MVASTSVGVGRCARIPYWRGSGLDSEGENDVAFSYPVHGELRTGLWRACVCKIKKKAVSRLSFDKSNNSKKV